MSLRSKLANEVSTEGFARALPAAVRDVSFAVVVVLALMGAFFFVSSGVSDDVVGFDFEGTLWNAGIAIRDGRSPYPTPVVAEIEVGNPALYPPLLMLFVVPLTLLPWWVGVTVWTALLIAAVGGSLYVLGVRDPRCYTLALISAPAIVGFIWGNATLLLLPLVALAWHWRDNWRRGGVVVGLAIAAKLFLWPLLFWLLGTRRYKAFGAAVAVTCVGIIAPWAVIGFNGFSSYPALLGVADEVYAIHGYSVATMLSALGVATGFATGGAIGVGFAIAGLAFVAARRGEDEISISLAVLAAILGSPIVWGHYYVLLLAPLAIARPRFSTPWLLLTLFYVTYQFPRPRLLATELEQGGSACCKPDDVPLSSWVFNHAPPGLWPALGNAALAGALIAAAVIWSTPRARHET